MSFTLNTKDFDMKFLNIAQTVIPGRLAKSMFKTGSIILRDAILEEPRAPHKTGHLWRSQVVEPIIDFNSIGIIVGFNTPYAARLHEWTGSVGNWTLAGSGPKYLETKLVLNKEKYIRITAEGIGEER
jgi:hypothetical protein